MSTTVSPTLFRLRSFESEFDRLISAAGGGLFSDALRSEADAWLQLGQEIDYFPTTNDGAWARTTNGSWVTHGLDRDALGAEPLSEFDGGLVEAWEDLTPARLEFLALLLDADERAWHARLTEVVELMTNAVETTDNPALGEQLDRASWFLLGADSQLSDGLLPARWRSMDLATIEQQTEFGAIRFAELHEAWAVAEMTATRLTSRELEAELANARRGPTVMRNVWNRFLHRVRAFEVLETSTGLPEALGSGAGGSDARRRREAARTERTLAAVTKRPGISIPELAEEIGATRKQLHQLLPKLEREGMVEETRSGGWRPGPAGRRFESAGPGQED